jgi:uncharacterized damage-inducible protein DinB
MENGFEKLVFYADQEFNGTIYHGHAFNGKSLIATLGSIKAKEAGSFDTYEGYTVSEIALHLAYCKYRVAREILGDDKVEKYPFPIGLEGFFDIENIDEGKWKSVIEYLKKIHEITMSAIKEVDSSRLENQIKEWDMSLDQAIIWICNHDTYHLAQIRNMNVPGMVKSKIKISK